MRPSSLRHEPTETCRPSLKRARHAVKLDIRAGPASEWNPNEPPETGFAEMRGAHSSWRSSEAKRMDVA